MLTVKLLPEFAFIFMMIFARLGTVFMFIPAIGDRVIPARIRLALALATTFIVYPILKPFYTPAPTELMMVAVGLFHELFVGFLMGMVIRLSSNAMQIGGVIIAQQIGLGFASQVDPTQREQSLVLTNFLVLFGAMLVLATDTHHLAIEAIVSSYNVFQYKTGIIPEDVLKISIMTITETFRLAVQISAPFLVFGLVFNVGLAIVARVMPQLQVFFLAMPLTIVLGFFLFAAILGVVSEVYLDHMRAGIMRFTSQ